MLPFLFTMQALSALKDKPVEPVSTEPTSSAFWSNAAARQAYRKRQVSDLDAVLKIANRKVFSVDEVADLLSKNQSLLKAVLTVWVDKNKDGRISEEEFLGNHCKE